MGRNNSKKFKLNESASFNVPEKKEREKSAFEDFILKLLGRIILTKSVFFGMDNKKIVIFVTPSLKIAHVVSDPKKLTRNFPFTDGSVLNFDDLTKWCQENKFEITFSATTPKLKRILTSKLGDVMLESKEKKEIDLDIKLLPESIKEWAEQNPEKFKSNIDHIRRLLG